MWTIHEATLAELDIASMLFDSYRQFYQYRSDVSASREFLKARLSQRESRVFLASVDDVAGGFMQLYPSFSSLSLKNVWILYDLFVAPHARRQGVGRQLLEQARRLAEETGASELTLSTAKTNAGAQSLYEELRWVRDDVYYVYNLSI